MRVRLYTIEKRVAPGDTRPHFWLVSYLNDLFDLDVDTPARVVSALRGLPTRKYPVALFTMESDPEMGYELPSKFVTKAARERAVRMWSKGKCVDLPEDRTL